MTDLPTLFTLSLYIGGTGLALALFTAWWERRTRPPETIQPTHKGK